ncbi:MAG TPA: response regulator [Blastocatellia bacterium]|jgi:CheY-like chemotaxis protein
MATRVLFVDQSAVIQKMAAQAFSQEKMEVIKVSNGDIATWLINQINPDIVITDVSVPDKSGYELCQYIKSDPRLSHIPVVLLYRPDETFDTAKADGVHADAYLAKPFESQTLIETAKRLLEKGREKNSFSAPPPAPFTNVESASLESDEPLDLSDLFAEADFYSHAQATGAASDFPLVIEDPPARPGESPATAADEKPPAAMAAPHKPLSTGTTRRAGSRMKMASLAVVATAVLAVALTLWLWRATRIHKTQPGVSPGVGFPQNEPQANSAASPRNQPPTPPQKESPESKAVERETATGRNAPSSLREDRNSNNQPASIYAMKSATNANRLFEDRRANYNSAGNSTANRPPQSTPPAPYRASTTPAKSDRADQSPVRILPSNRTAPTLPGGLKAASASQQTTESGYGIRQVGSEVKSALVWTGRKVGRGLKTIGRELKRAFRHDSKID